MLDKIVRDIKAVRIQGAQSIAFAALDALGWVVHKSRATTPKRLLAELMSAKKRLDGARATEPLLRNYTAGVLDDIDVSSLSALRESVLKNIAGLRKKHRGALESIMVMGEQKVPKGATIFTHCHSSTVTGIIKAAHKNKKRVIAINTEARPLFQGRITAKELAAAGIKVHHFVDSSAHEAIRQADMVLLGCDAITSDGVINKIGSGLFAELADRFDVPLYICTHALKLDPTSLKGRSTRIEERDPKEVWKQAPKRVTIHNPAFELIEPKHITGIISELGIYPHATFIEEVRRAYPWVFGYR